MALGETTFRQEALISQDKDAFGSYQLIVFVHQHPAVTGILTRIKSLNPVGFNTGSPEQGLSFNRWSRRERHCLPIVIEHFCGKKPLHPQFLQVAECTALSLL